MVVPEERPESIVVILDGHVSSGTVRRLFDSVWEALEDNDAQVVVCDVAALDQPFPEALDVIDALARLQLAVKRQGRSLRLRNVPRQLDDLLKLTGLDDVFR